MDALNVASLPASAMLLVDSAPIICTLSAARLRGQYGLKLPDAIQLASARAINADALVTDDRDIAEVRGLRILT